MAFQRMGSGTSGGTSGNSIWIRVNTGTSPYAYARLVDAENGTYDEEVSIYNTSATLDSVTVTMARLSGNYYQIMFSVDGCWLEHQNGATFYNIQRLSANTYVQNTYSYSYMYGCFFIG